MSALKISRNLYTIVATPGNLAAPTGTAVGPLSTRTAVHPRLREGLIRGMGRHCCRLRRAAAVGSVRRPSPGRTAMGEKRRFRPFAGPRSSCRSRTSTVVRCDRPRWQVIRTPDLRAEVFGGHRSSPAYRRRVRRWRRDPNRQPQAALRHVRLLPYTGPAPARAAEGARAAAGFAQKS